MNESNERAKRSAAPNETPALKDTACSSSVHRELLCSHRGSRMERACNSAGTMPKAFPQLGLVDGFGHRLLGRDKPAAGEIRQ